MTIRNNDSAAEGVVLDRSGTESERILRECYNSQELSDALIDRALEKTESLVSLGQTVDECEWREASYVDKEWMTPRGQNWYPTVKHHFVCIYFFDVYDQCWYEDRFGFQYRRRI